MNYNFLKIWRNYQNSVLSLFCVFLMFGSYKIYCLYIKLNWLYCIIYFGNWTLTWHIMGKYVLPYSWFPFHFDDGFFSCAEAFQFDVFDLIWFSLSLIFSVSVQCSSDNSRCKARFFVSVSCLIFCKCLHRLRQFSKTEFLSEQ